jgi:2-dehydropantoate 2-reductase
MRLLIVGAGSTGGYFGARLVAAGRDVTFLVRPARAAHLRTHGLQVTSPHGDLSLFPSVVTADALQGPVDAVLLTVKAYALDAALDDLAPAVGPETMVLPVLNGMRHVGAIRARFGDGALVGCTCKVATVLDKDGRIIQLAPFQELAYGEMDGSLSPRIKALDAFMTGAGFDAKLSTSIELEMWHKWILLSALGAINCLMDGTVGDVVATPGGPAFVLRLLDEVASVAVAEGHRPAEPFLATARDMLTAAGSQQTSSMFRDMKNGLPVEAGQIVGDLLARGQAHGLDLPLLGAAFSRLCVYEGRIA